MRKTKDLFEFKNIPLNVHTKTTHLSFFCDDLISFTHFLNRLSKASESQTLNY